MDTEQIISGVIRRIMNGEKVPVKREHQKELMKRLQLSHDIQLTVTDDPTSTHRVIISRNNFDGGSMA
jgi:hypothetical protein